MVTSGIADWSRIETMKSLARRAFLILEKAWKRINVTLVDFKAKHPPAFPLLGVPELCGQALGSGAHGCRCWEQVEFGISQAGDLVLADVIDNDSWRLWPNGEKRLMKDKQVYRNMSIPGPGQITEEQRRIVLENYTWVAEQSKKLVDSIATAQVFTLALFVHHSPVAL